MLKSDITYSNSILIININTYTVIKRVESRARIIRRGYRENLSVIET